MKRFADSIHHVLTLLPECDVAVLSGAAVVFRWHGLEFARARISHEAGSFRSGQDCVWRGARHQAPGRLHPERWLASLVVRDVSAVDERLDPGSLYSQVPAFSASDRAMLDVLTSTRDNRLAVVELKADEDIIFRCRDWITGHASSGFTLAESFGSSGTFPGGNFPRRIPCFSWWLPRCTSTLRAIPCCTTSVRKLIVIFRKRAKVQYPPQRHRCAEEHLPLRTSAH